MYLSQKPTSNYSIANITCQCYLTLTLSLGPVDVYVATNQYSKYFYRNIGIYNCSYLYAYSYAFDWFSGKPLSKTKSDIYKLGSILVNSVFVSMVNVPLFQT